MVVLGRGAISTGRASARRAATLGILLLVAAPFLVRPELIGGDEPHYAAMTWSVAVDGDFDPTNQYEQSRSGELPTAGQRFLGAALEPHLVAKPAGEVSSHPIGLPVLAAAPLAMAVRLAVPGVPDLVLGLLSALISFLGFRGLEGLLESWLGDAHGARVVAVVTFFATPLWFYSRTFFTEPWLAALLLLATGCVARDRPVAAGLLLGVSIVIKDQALLPVLFVVAIAARRLGWARACRLLPGLAMAGVAFVARNVLLYGSGGFDFPQRFRSGSLLEGAAGLLVDPARGLLFFAPIVLLAFAGFLARPGERGVVCAACACFLVYFLLNAAWIDWRGGSSFGPRLLVPVLPLLAIPVGLLWRQARQRGGVRIAVALLAAFGFAVEAVAVSSPFRAFWSPTVAELAFSSASRAATFGVAFLGGMVWCLRAMRSATPGFTSSAAASGAARSDSEGRGRGSRAGR